MLLIAVVMFWEYIDFVSALNNIKFSLSFFGANLSYFFY